MCVTQKPYLKTFKLVYISECIGGGVSPMSCYCSRIFYKVRRKVQFMKGVRPLVVI